MSELIKYEIPPSWIWTQIGKISHVEKEHIEPKETPHTEFNYLSIENVESETGNLVKFRPTKGNDIGSSKLKFTIKDILYSKLRPYLNKVYIPTFSGISATDLVPIRPEEGIEREYLAYYLRTQKIVEYLNSIVHGIQLPRVSVDDLLITRFPLAPSKEQKRILSKIGELSRESKSAHDALDKIPEIMKKFRQSILISACTGKLTSDWRQRNRDIKHASELLEHIENSIQKKFEDESKLAKTERRRKPKPPKFLDRKKIEIESLPGIPSTWAWSYLQNLGELSRGKSKHRPRNDPKLFGGKYPFIQTGDVARSNGKITTYTQTYNETGLSQSRLFPKNTLCITIAANIADTGILDFPACFPDSVVGFIPIAGTFEVLYMLYYLKVVQSNLETFAPATAQKNINLDILGEVTVPVPPLEEQREIVRIVESNFELANQIEKSVEEAKERADRIDQAILAKAFRGELVPQDPNDEPASVLLERIKNEKEKTIEIRSGVKRKHEK